MYVCQNSGTPTVVVFLLVSLSTDPQTEGALRNTQLYGKLGTLCHHLRDLRHCPPLVRRVPIRTCSQKNPPNRGTWTKSCTRQVEFSAFIPSAVRVLIFRGCPLRLVQMKIHHQTIQNPAKVQGTGWPTKPPNLPQTAWNLQTGREAARRASQPGGYEAAGRRLEARDVPQAPHRPVRAAARGAAEKRGGRERREALREKQKTAEGARGFLGAGKIVLGVGVLFWSCMSCVCLELWPVSGGC